MKYELVIVSWNDVVDHGDGEVAPRHTPALQRTAGFLLRRDRRGISIATEINSDGSGWRGENFIPRKMIVNVQRTGYKA